MPRNGASSRVLRNCARPTPKRSALPPQRVAPANASQNVFADMRSQGGDNVFTDPHAATAAGPGSAAEAGAAVADTGSEDLAAAAALASTSFTQRPPTQEGTPANV